MIKKLSFKFVLVFLVLAVVVFTVSTCYATPSTSTSSIISDTPFSLNDVINSTAYKNYVNNTGNFSNKTIDDLDFLIFSGSLSTYNIYIYFDKYPDGAYFDKDSSSSNYFYIYDSSGNILNQYTSYLWLKYDVATGVFSTTAINGSTSMFSNINLVNLTNFYLSDLTTLEVKAFSLAYVPSVANVKVTHEFQSDTSAKVTFDYSSYGSNASVLKYSLTGVEINTDLTAPIQLRNPVTYTPRSNKFSC